MNQYSAQWQWDDIAPFFELIAEVRIDSRQVGPGDAYVALTGARVDGHDFISAAIQAGASLVICEKPCSCEVPQLVLPDLAGRLADIAIGHYGPSPKPKLLGVTGTNGKTSITQLVSQALAQQGIQCGVIGTIGYGIWPELSAGQNTTPDVLTIYSLLRSWASRGVEYAAIEVSSHALELGRLRGLVFHTVAFTNLSQDHLDYHQTLERYAQAKSRLFSEYHAAHAVINSDNAFAPIMLAAWGRGQGLITCGRNASDLKLVDMHPRVDGLDLNWLYRQKTLRLQSPLLGDFNAENLTVTLGILLSLGISGEQATHMLSFCKPVQGRMEVISFEGRAAVIDYAHTPDALEKALVAVRHFVPGRIVCVVGCGGDRDRGKRPKMAKIACQYADQVYFTDDNPRTEDPEQIFSDMRAGVPAESDITWQHNRRQAIQQALASLKPNDLLLIAGKGHENYQETAEGRIHFSDREEVEVVWGVCV